MKTTNNHYNPIFKATYAAFTELTTAEANAWYRGQAKATAAWLMAIAQNGTAAVGQWLKPQNKVKAVEPVTDAEAEAEAISPVNADIALAAETVAEDPTELRLSEVADEAAVTESTFDYKYLTELLAINPESQNAADAGDATELDNAESILSHSATQNQSHLPK